MRNNFFGVAVLLIVSSSPLASTTDIPIYKWLDENNVVHFSQAYPTDINYTEISVEVAYKPSINKAKNPATELNISNQDQKISEQQTKNLAKIEKNCKTAQMNNKILSGLNKVLVTDENGLEKLINEKERKEQLALSKKQIEIYCETN